MKQYSYRSGAQHDTFSSKLKQRLGSFSPTHKEVQGHMKLLIAQGILLVLLALVHIGIEAHTVQMEASVYGIYQDAIVNNRRPSEKLTAEKEKDPFTKAVLGSEDEIVINKAKEKEETELPKDVYWIALTGDSMIETLGDAKHLQNELEEKYEGTEFKIFNYAKGARNVSTALEDFDDSFIYKEYSFSPIQVLKPDVVIVGSSAYNVFDPPNRDLHWLEYTRLVQEAQKITPHVYMLAEPAPRRSGFGIGVDGLVWEPSTAWTHTGHIIDQLENVLALSDTLGIPVIDAYTPSLEDGAQQGKRELINTSDNIHLSEEGKIFLAKKIVEVLDFEEIR